MTNVVCVFPVLCLVTFSAPHSVDEKDSETPPPGYPGLETMLPLLLTAVKNGRLTIDDIVLRLYTNPLKIFGLHPQPNTYIDVSPCFIVCMYMLMFVLLLFVFVHFYICIVICFCPCLCLYCCSLLMYSLSWFIRNWFI